MYVLFICSEVVPMCPASKVGNNNEHVKLTKNVR